MRSIRSLITVLALFVGLGVSANAADTQTDDKVAKLIDSVVSAYGGDALINLKNFKAHQYYITHGTGQSWSPTLENVGRLNQLAIHDIAGGRLYREGWFDGRGGIGSNGTLVNGDVAWDFNLQTGRYSDPVSVDPYVVVGPTMRTSDTLLALELHKSRAAAVFAGDVDFMSRPHKRLTIPFPQSPDLTLYIDADSYLISRMTRENPQLGLLDYVFQGHQSTGGITHAVKSDFFVAGHPNLIALRWNIEFNVALDESQFELPDDMRKESERVDTSEMMANRLAGNVYHVGQGAGFSLFVDTAQGIVATGGYPGLSQRLERFRSETGSHRQLAYQVVTHHHQDHLGGLGEALDLGARLVTVAGTIDTIRESLSSNPGAGQFLSVTQRLTLGSGADQVEIYRISTVHAKDYLLVFAPASRTLFTADHFGTPFEKGTPVATRNTVSLHRALEELDLNFNKIVTAHGGRVFSRSDFEKSVDEFEDRGCLNGRPLCVEF